MPVVTLTDITLRSLRPTPGKQVTYVDKSLKGFGVRVNERGMSYVLTFGPDRRRIKIADVGVVPLKDARTKAKTILAEMQLGLAKPEAAPTFDEAKVLFLSVCESKNKARTVRDYTRLLNRHFAFGRKPINEITPQDINRRIDRLQKTISEQNHALVAIKVFFRWAQRRHYIAHSPCEGMQTIKRPARKRVLAENELAKVYRAAEQFGYPFGTIVQLCILTGQRRSEVAWLRRSYFANDCCTLPGSLTKNKRDHTFPIGTMARSIIDNIPHDSDFLFPAQRGNTVFGGWSKQKMALDGLCGIDPWTLHDLRRTFAHQWQRLGIKIEHTEAALNHISGTRGGIVGVYQTYNYEIELRTCYAQWEGRLQSILRNSEQKTHK
jgi:integrase